MQEYKHEFVILEENIPFKIFEFEGRYGNYSVPKHWHNDLEIFCVLEGHIDFYINSRRYDLNAGNSIIVNSCEIHSIIAPEPNKVVVVQVPKNVLNMYNGEHNIHFSDGYECKDEKIFIMINNLFDINNERKNGFIYKLLGQCYMLLDYIFENYRDEASANVLRELNNISKLTEIAEYISDNSNKDLKLAEVAEKFGYTISYLSRVFRKNTGVNYKIYLDTVRLNKAYNELLNTDNLISDIAYNNGFANTKSFINIFKKRYGMTPYAYRKKIKNDNFISNNII